MEFKSAAQACFNQLPPNRKAKEIINAKRAPTSEPKGKDTWRKIEEIKDRMALKKELEL